MSEIQEQALLLGPRRSLVGVYSLPATSGSVPRPTVVILSAGILPRAGANRLHVLLARTLAALGFPVLRFDLSGIGDSEPREDALPLLDGVQADIREVMDQLAATRGASQFVLAGLCSGAMHALLVGADDPRVTGLVMLDIFIPRTPGFYLRYYSRRSLNLRGVWRFLTGRHPAWPRLRQQFARWRSRGDASGADTAPSVAEAVRVMQDAFASVVRRNVKLLAVFTSGLTGQHNYRRQLPDAFPNVAFGQGLRLEYFQDVDHTFTLSRNQARLLALVSEWAEGAFPREPVGAREAAGTAS